MKTHDVTFQISLAPSDFRHAQHMLEHQVEALSHQAGLGEVLLTYDTHRSKGRFAENWESNHARMTAFLADFAKRHPSVRIVTVDYGADVRRAIGEMFFAKGKIPQKDFRGGPFYSYFYGLYAAKHDYVLHADSDIFFGGGSTTWIAEAVALMERDGRVLFAGPLPGPPRADGQLVGQPSARAYSLESAREGAGATPAFAFDGMSTRIFLVDRRKLVARKLHLARPSRRETLKALVDGNPPVDLPERLFAQHMAKHGLLRVDLLGTKPGLWSLHPPYRTATFYDGLPTLIARVAADDFPAEQRGFYDVVDAVCDWSEARARLRANTWWRRAARKARAAVAGAP